MTQRKPGGCQLLIHEAPLQVLPSLAVAVGLNEAIILQQLHYWLQRSEHTMEGKSWIYNTFVQWQTQFPFWHFNTIKRAMHHLEELGVVDATTRFNRNPIDKTWWYTINYERLEDFCRPPMNQDDSSTDHHDSSTDHDGSSTDHDGSTMNHLDTLDEPSWLDRQTIMVHLPEITSEITTEISDPLPIVLPPTTKKGRAEQKKDAWRDVLAHLIRVSGRPFRTPGMIVSALTQGYLVEDLLLVIDWWAAVKTVEDPSQNKYFDNDTPFRPTKIDKYHAAAVVWDREGRPAALRPGVIHPISAQAVQALVKEVHDDGGPRLPALFNRPQHPRRSLGGSRD